MWILTFTPGAWSDGSGWWSGHDYSFNSSFIENILVPLLRNRFFYNQCLVSSTGTVHAKGKHTLSSGKSVVLKAIYSSMWHLVSFFIFKNKALCFILQLLALSRCFLSHLLHLSCAISEMETCSCSTFIHLAVIITLLLGVDWSHLDIFPYE